jgi:S-adenosylmethionine:tRNA ribosyltransferase-isomerase
MPVPPYIKRKSGERVEDKEDYQTIFAQKAGAVAAPTAGLHFTEELFKTFEERGIEKCFVTLHVGAGTFLPVKTDNIKDHKMHSEWYEIDKDVANKINQTKADGGRIICIGTTSLRTLESAADKDGNIIAGSNDTEIFIYPGYKFKTADMLLTNFHLPRSTLFMLVSAFAGTKTMHEAYEHAIHSKYRFFSYGDACLIYRNNN